MVPQHSRLRSSCQRFGGDVERGKLSSIQIALLRTHSREELEAKLQKIAAAEALLEDLALRAQCTVEELRALLALDSEWVRQANRTPTAETTEMRVPTRR